MDKEIFDNKEIANEIDKFLRANISGNALRMLIDRSIEIGDNGYIPSTLRTFEIAEDSITSLGRDKYEFSATGNMSFMEPESGLFSRADINFAGDANFKILSGRPIVTDVTIRHLHRTSPLKLKVPGIPLDD